MCRVHGPDPSEKASNHKKTRVSDPFNLTTNSAQAAQPGFPGPAETYLKEDAKSNIKKIPNRSSNNCLSRLANPSTTFKSALAYATSACTSHHRSERGRQSKPQTAEQQQRYQQHVLANSEVKHLQRRIGKRDCRILFACAVLLLDVIIIGSTSAQHAFNPASLIDKVLLTHVSFSASLCALSGGSPAAVADCLASAASGDAAAAAAASRIIAKGAAGSNSSDGQRLQQNKLLEAQEQHLPNTSSSPRLERFLSHSLKRELGLSCVCGWAALVALGILSLIYSARIQPLPLPRPLVSPRPPHLHGRDSDARSAACGDHEPPAAVAAAAAAQSDDSVAAVAGAVKGKDSLLKTAAKGLGTAAGPVEEVDIAAAAATAMNDLAAAPMPKKDELRIPADEVGEADRNAAPKKPGGAVSAADEKEKLRVPAADDAGDDSELLSCCRTSNLNICHRWRCLQQNEEGNQFGNNEERRNRLDRLLPTTAHGKNLLRAGETVSDTALSTRSLQSCSYCKRNLDFYVQDYVVAALEEYRRGVAVEGKARLLSLCLVVLLIFFAMNFILQMNVRCHRTKYHLYAVQSLAGAAAFRAENVQSAQGNSIVPVYRNSSYCLVSPFIWLQASPNSVCTAKAKEQVSSAEENKSWEQPQQAESLILLPSYVYYRDIEFWYQLIVGCLRDAEMQLSVVWLCLHIIGVLLCRGVAREVNRSVDCAVLASS